MPLLDLNNVRSLDDLVSRMTNPFASVQEKQIVRDKFLDLWRRLVKIVDDRHVIEAGLLSLASMLIGIKIVALLEPTPLSLALAAVLGDLVGRYIHEYVYGTHIYFEIILANPITQRILNHLAQAEDPLDLCRRIHTNLTGIHTLYIETFGSTVGRALAIGTATFFSPPVGVVAKMLDVASRAVSERVSPVNVPQLT